MHTRRRRALATMVAVMVAAGVTGSTASAKPGAPANPAWQRADASLSSNGQVLSVDFKEVGLGSQYLSDSITISATVEALWGCFTRGPTSNHPKAENKEGPGTVSNTESFPARNGQVTGTIRLSIAAPDLCPSGQVERLISASYTNISISGAAGTTSTTPSSLFYP